jgi:hypothetical protein
MHTARLRAATALLPLATRDTQERRRVRSRSRSRLGRGREAVSRPGPRQMREHRMQAQPLPHQVQKRDLSGALPAENSRISQANTLSLNLFIVPAGSAPVNVATDLVAGGASGLSARATSASHCAKALGVETPMGGVTTTTCNRQIGQRVHFLTPSHSENGPANQKQRQVAAHLRRDAQLVCHGKLHSQSALQAKHRRDGIRRRCSHPPCTGKRFSISMTILH